MSIYLPNDVNFEMLGMTRANSIAVQRAKFKGVGSQA